MSPVFWEPLKSPSDVEQSIDNIRCEVAFITTFVSSPTDGDFQLSERAQMGLWMVMEGIAERLAECSEYLAANRAPAHQHIDSR